MILALSLFTLLAGPQAEPPAERPPLTWENLAERFASEEVVGFAGAVLVVRDDEIVLNTGFGLANREKKIPVTNQTIFAVGSTPIDFTKAGILMLVEEGEIWPDETLPAFFEDVPEDKRAITVEHLMTGRSGLRDFHDLPGDRDPDHSWIDLDEAVRRIFAQELLFEPGKGNEHSHSAWGLLAAILEIRSGKSYQEFTRERLFEPAGMKDTGFFGEPIDEARLAIGYGEKKDGEVNAPPWWGKTSWLVMGSGGMVSTTGDMLRWNQALRAGKLLSEEMLELYWAPPGAVLDGGDMYGYEILYTEGPGSLMIMSSSAIDRGNRRRWEQIGRQLATLVTRG